MATYIDLIDRKIMPFVQYGDYPDRYPALTALSFERDFYAEMREASRELFAIFEKAVKIFQRAPRDFQEQMEIPPKLVPFLNIPNALNLSTWLARFDFVLTQGGELKVVEINADTPCGIIEAYYANQIAADSFGVENPNFGAENDLADFLKNIKRQISPARINLGGGSFSRERPFVFSCFDDYVEDFGTTNYLMNLLRRDSIAGDVEFVSFYDLAVDEGGILLPDGRHAAALYRLHPMEILVEETATDGSELGVLFLQRYAEGKFALFNPPEAIIMQNKAFMALVWQLHLHGGYFTFRENEIIARYMLPSFFDGEDLGAGEFICKPIWGREGKNISIVRDGLTVFENEPEALDEIICRDSEKFMYQEFVEAPEFEVLTDSGRHTGFITLSCFMLGAEPSAVFCRFSQNRIIGTEAYFVPLVVN
ncbi:MAG: glutathionylspermidine synthase family protein [Selenomonadaceae bacterium]|nr:glutathionylspermidine synthase family protein [Selenomonadaceae bacterium]